MNQSQTPLFDQLLLHNKNHPLSFHVPGHKSGMLFSGKGSNYFQPLLPFDLTELTGLDDLHSPEGVILEAETLLSQLYQTLQSFFLINGSTAGNLAMILATVKKDDLILVQRNSHKSIQNGIRLANARPVFLYPEYESKSMVATGVSVETVSMAIKKYPQAKALILTYPNYYGMVTDLKEIIKLAHEHDIPVLIDEAHGVHFISGDPFPPSAITLGADLVVQSAHKTLPAMTMGAFLHYNSKIVSLESLRFYLQALQSSSPSYPIMASLDLARSYLGTFDYYDKQRCVELLEEFRSEINNIDGLIVLPVGNGDPLKMVIQSTEQLTGFELQKRFERHGVYPELADPYNLLFVLPLLKGTLDFPFERAIDRIKRAMIAEHVEGKLVPARTMMPNNFERKIGSLEVTSDEMEKLKAAYVPLSDAKGKICAETITPYPPGIPLLLPGERIYIEDLDRLKVFLSQKAKIQGGERLLHQEIKVYIKS